MLYSLFYLASYFGLSFFVLSNRGMVEHVVEGSVISEFWDVAVWGSGVFVVCAWLFYRLNRRMVGVFSRIVVNIVLFIQVGWVFLVVFGLVSVVSLSLVSGLILIICLMFSSVVFNIWWFKIFLRVLFGGVLLGILVEVAALFLFNVPTTLNMSPGAFGWHLETVELIYSNLTYPLLPFVYLLFVLLGVFGLVIEVLPWRRLVGKVRDAWFTRFNDYLSGLFTLIDNGELRFLRGRLVVYISLLAGAVVSCLFVVFTVLPWVNPTNMLVSVDAPSYYTWIVHMRSGDFNSALGFAFGNDRALFLVLAYGLSFFISPVWVVQFASAFLIVAFGGVSFLVLRRLCRFRVVWVFGVLLVPFSFQALGLIYSGYFANMLALILVLAYVVLFFRVLDRWSSWGFLALLGVSVCVLFSHSWTWFIFALSLLVFMFLQWRLASSDRRLWDRFKTQGVFVGATLGVGFFCDLARKLLSPVSSTASVLTTAGSSLGLPNLSYVFDGLQKSVDFVLGGVFANGLLVFLCVVGFLVLLKFKSEVSRFFVAWIFVGCVSILFAAESFVFDRFLFLMPWVILSALGLFWGIGFVSGQANGWRSGRFWVLLSVLVFIFLMLLNGSLRFLFNINVW